MSRLFILLVSAASALPFPDGAGTGAQGRDGIPPQTFWPPAEAPELSEQGGEAGPAAQSFLDELYQSLRARPVVNVPQPIPGPAISQGFAPVYRDGKGLGPLGARRDAAPLVYRLINVRTLGQGQGGRLVEAAPAPGAVSPQGAPGPAQVVSGEDFRVAYAPDGLGGVNIRFKGVPLGRGQSVSLVFNQSFDLSGGKLVQTLAVHKSEAGEAAAKNKTDEAPRCPYYKDGMKCGCWMGKCWSVLSEESGYGDPWCYTQPLGIPAGQEQSSYCSFDSHCRWGQTCANNETFTDW